MILQAAGAILSVVGIVADFILVDHYDQGVSQIESFMILLESGATLGDFISQCWLVLLLGVCLIFVALDFAFPKRRVRS